MKMVDKFLCWAGWHVWVPGFDLSPKGKVKVVFRCQRCPARRDDPPTCLQGFCRWGRQEPIGAQNP